jgi:acetyltransferase-like isoleucine patch superfamily enzyme
MLLRRSDIARLRKEIRVMGHLAAVEMRTLVRRAENRRRVVAGKHSYFFGGPNVTAYRGDPEHLRVRVGSYTSVAEGTRFLLGGGHRVDWVSTFPFRVALGLPGAYMDGHPTAKGDILVGSDVWIGKDAQILGGVTIGHGAVVAASSVVTRDVAAYEIVAGNPARTVRCRVTPEQREALLALSWWDWPDSKILRFVDLLSSPEVDEFILRAQDG